MIKFLEHRVILDILLALMKGLNPNSLPKTL